VEAELMLVYYSMVEEVEVIMYHSKTEENSKRCLEEGVVANLN
jgi:hypothetical protein